MPEKHLRLGWQRLQIPLIVSEVLNRFFGDRLIACGTIDFCVTNQYRRFALILCFHAFEYSQRSNGI